MTNHTPPNRRETATSRKAAVTAAAVTAAAVTTVAAPAARASNTQQNLNASTSQTSSHDSGKPTYSTAQKLTSKETGTRPKVPQHKSQSQLKPVPRKPQSHAIVVNNPVHAATTTQSLITTNTHVTAMQQHTEVPEAAALPSLQLSSQPMGVACQEAASQLEGIPSSTPVTSPAFTGRRSPPFLDISDEMWSTTPFQQSSGIGLIAAPSPIYSLPKKPSVAQLENSLEKLTDHIEHFGARFRDTERWRDHIQEQSVTFSRDLDIIQARSVEVHAMSALAKCFALKSLLGNYTEELLADAKVLVNNPTNVQVEIRHSILAQPMVTGNMETIVTRNQELHEISSVTSKLQTTQNQEVQEPPVPDPILISFGELCNKVSALESLTPTLQSVPELDRRLTLVEKYRARAATVDDLATRVTLLEEVMKVQDSQLVFGTRQIKTLEEKLTGITLACRQYEQIASGVVLENIQLKKQFQTLLSRMENLQDQVDGANSRINNPMENDVTADANSSSIRYSLIPTGPIIRSTTAIPGIHPLSDVSISQIVTTNTRLINTCCIMSSGHNLNVPIYTQSTLHQPTLSGFRSYQPEGNLQFPQGQHQLNHLQQPLMEDGPTLQSGSLDSSPASSMTGMDHLSREGRRRKKMTRNLRKMLYPCVSTEIPKSTLQDIYKSTVSTVDSERKDLLKALDRYEKGLNQDFRLCDEVDDTIEDAANWTAGMREMH